MNKFYLIRAGIDYDSGLERFSDNVEMYEATLQMFPDDENFPELEEAIREDNRQNAFSCAHALKGISGNLSMNRLYHAVSELVECLRGTTDGDPEELFRPVKKEYKIIVAALLEAKE